MRIVICDDEEKIVATLTKLCEKFVKEKNVEAECIGVTDPIKAIASNPDILVLDVEMPGMNGIEVKDVLEFSNKETLIIFITNYVDTMQKAFGRDVIGFLTKPVDEEQFKKVFNKGIVLMGSNLLVSFEDGTSFSSDSIRLIKVSGNYTDVFTTQGTISNQRRSLKQWMGQLTDVGFIQINESTIINCRYILKFTNNNAKVVLEQNLEFEVSRRRKSDCLEQYTQFCRKMARFV